MSKYSYNREKTKILNEGIQDSAILGAIFSSSTGEIVKKDAASLDVLVEQVQNGIDTEFIHGISAQDIELAVENQQLDAFALDNERFFGASADMA